LVYIVATCVSGPSRWSLFHDGSGQSRCP